jgi:SsrA-binding protein
MGIKIITDNRKARFHYEIIETFETGLVLKGSEVKSLREGKVNISEAYAGIYGEEIYLVNAHISPYQTGNFMDHEPFRKRKLLLHKAEIKRLIGTIKEKRLTLIALKLYFKKGKVKLELALAKGKKLTDKRQTIKKRMDERQIRREIKQHQR